MERDPCPYECEDGHYLVPGHGGGLYPCPRCRPEESARVVRTMIWVLAVCAILFVGGLLGMILEIWVI